MAVHWGTVHWSAPTEVTYIAFVLTEVTSANFGRG